MVVFRQIARPETGCLAYLVGDEHAKECALIDVPEDPTRLLDEAARAGLRVAKVIETHTHADHVSGARTLAARLGIKPTVSFLSRARYAHEAMVDGQDVRVGDLRMRALHTPGHTRCSMSLLLDDRAIVGDALLVGTVGRSDFYPDGPEEMYHTVFDKLVNLREDILVYPAHFGPHHGLPDELSTTVGREKRLSEPLNLRNKDDFIRYMTEGWPPKPARWKKIVETNDHE